MRAVIVAAPHTSNWDFIFFILAAWALKAPVRWMGKKEMFPLPVKWLFVRMGGVPINRGAAGGVVSQMVTAFELQKLPVNGSSIGNLVSIESLPRLKCR